MHDRVRVFIELTRVAWCLSRRQLEVALDSARNRGFRDTLSRLAAGIGVRRMVRDGPILVILPNLEFGGVVRLVGRIVEILESTGTSVVLMTEGASGKRELAPGIIVDVVAADFRDRKALLLTLADRCTAERVRMLWNFGEEGIYDIVGPLKLIHPDLKCADFLLNDWWHLPAFLKRARSFDAVFVETEVLEARLGAAGIRRPFVRRLRLGLSASWFRFPPRSDAEKLCVGFVGRLSWEKGPDLFLAIANRLADRPDIQFLIVGDGPMRQSICRTVHGDRRINLAGFVADVRPFMARIAVLVVPSRVDGCPNVILEALACGVPVVAARVGGIPEMFVDRREGLLCRMGAVREFECAIRRILQPAQLAEFSRRARRKSVMDLQDRAPLDSMREALTGLAEI